MCARLLTSKRGAKRPACRVTAGRTSGLRGHACTPASGGARPSRGFSSASPPDVPAASAFARCLAAVGLRRHPGCSRPEVRSAPLPLQVAPGHVQASLTAVHSLCAWRLLSWVCGTQAAARMSVQAVHAVAADPHGCPKTRSVLGLSFPSPLSRRPRCFFVVRRISQSLELSCPLPFLSLLSCEMITLCQTTVSW